MDFSILTTSDFFGIFYIFFIMVFISFSIFKGLFVFQKPFKRKDDDEFKK